jgi:hypothetical protein
MNPIIDKLAYQTGMYCDGTPDSWDSEAINNFANAIIEDVLNTVQEYGDIQLKKWQDHTTGDNQKPAAERIYQLIRERYDDR